MDSHQNRSRLKLYPYQEQSVQELERLEGRALLGLEMGLGKTIVTLEALRRNPDWLPALIVVPSSVKHNWEYEARHNIGFSSSICDGTIPPRHANSKHFASPLTIINYDILKDWVPYLKKLGFRTVAFDECQYLKNTKAKRTKAAKAVAKGADHVIAISGTPLTNQPSELWPILNILWPKVYSSYWSFAQSYCNPRWRPWGWDYSGASNLGQLHAELLDIGMIRRRKADVLKDLPSKVRRIQPCYLSDEREYKHANEDFLHWLQKNAPHKVRSAGRAEKLVKVGYLLRLVAKLKMRSVVDWCNRFLSETDEKLALFATHTKAIELLDRRVNAKSVVVNGSVTGRDRQYAVDQFQKDGKTRLFIGNIKAAGVGITLTAASEGGIVELPWHPGDLNQVEDRLHRITQKRTTFINFLVAGGTIEEKLCRILQEKQEVTSAVLDGGPTTQDINIYDELIKELES